MDHKFIDQTARNIVRNDVMANISGIVAALPDTCEELGLYAKWDDCTDCEWNGCGTCDLEGGFSHEVYEHYIVSQWLCDELEKMGEAVSDDFHGSCVWGRTTTGQAIEMDHVIKEIAWMIASK